MYRVAIVGLTGSQPMHLRSKLDPSVELQVLAPSSALHTGRLECDLVLCTQFLSHKHSDHLRRVCSCRFVYRRGGLSAWAEAIETERSMAAIAALA